MNTYNFHVDWSEEDGEFVGTCEEYPSLSYLDSNYENAQKGIQDLVITIEQDEEFENEFFEEA